MPLGFNVFTAPEKLVVGERPRPFGPPLGWDPTTSTLIFGEREAVLVDALTTVAEAEALAAWIALHNRKLTTIYITHGHFDHFYGLCVLLRHFPDAQAIATPRSVELMHSQAIPLQHFFRQCWPGQIPASITAAESFDGDTFTLEGHELRIIEQGRTDTVHTTSVHVPSIDLVVGGDVLYNQCNMYVGGTTAESRANVLRRVVEQFEVAEHRGRVLLAAGQEQPRRQRDGIGSDLVRHGRRDRLDRRQAPPP